MPTVRLLESEYVRLNIKHLLPVKRVSGERLREEVSIANYNIITEIVVVEV